MILIICQIGFTTKSNKKKLFYVTIYVTRCVNLETFPLKEDPKDPNPSYRNFTTATISQKFHGTEITSGITCRSIRNHLSENDRAHEDRVRGLRVSQFTRVRAHRATRLRHERT